jgi:hypothetical protein
MLAAVVLTGLTVDASGVSLGLIALLVGDPQPARIVAGVLAAAPRIGVTLLWLMLRKSAS